MPYQNIQGAALDALYVQDACNVSGIARSFVDAVDAARADLQERGIESSSHLAKHPVVVMFVNKLESLCASEYRFSAAYKACRALSGEEPCEGDPIDFYYGPNG